MRENKKTQGTETVSGDCSGNDHRQSMPQCGRNFRKSERMLQCVHDFAMMYEKLPQCVSVFSQKSRCGFGKNEAGVKKTQVRMLEDCEHGEIDRTRRLCHVR